MLTLLFGLLNIPSVQEYAKELIVKELTDKVQTDLGISRLSFRPFNTIQIDSLYLNDHAAERILLAKKVSASIDIFALLKGKIVVNSIRLSDFDIHLWKNKSDSTLNIQYVIDAFASDDKEKSANNLNIKLSAIHIENGRVSYDVKDKEAKSTGFDINHISVTDLNAKVSIKSILSDSLNIQVKKVSLKEKSGLEITNLLCRLITQNDKASLKGFRLDLPSSYLELDKFDVDLSKPQGIESTNILDYASFYCVITPSYIAPKDVSAFTSTLQYFNDLLTLQGTLHGTLNNLKIENLSLDLGDKMHLVTHAEIKDVRDANKMYILGSIDKLILSYDGIEGLANNFSQNENKLPAEIKRLGTISFTGDVSGYLDKLKAFGSLDTQLGVVNTDATFGFNPTKGLKSFFKGKVYTTNFKLGNLLANDDFDTISLNLEIDISQSKADKMKGSLKGNIYDWHYKDYVYKDITFDTDYDGLRLDGRFLVNTLYGSLGVEGLLDMTNKDLPELDVVVNAENIELDDLQLTTKYQNSMLNFIMHANFKGKNIDDMVGFIKVDSLDFYRDGESYRLQHFLLSASKDSTASKLTLSSDIIDGEVAGAYSFATMASSIQRTLHPYLPAFIELPADKDEKMNNLIFSLKVKNTEALSAILDLPVTVIKPVHILGNYNNISDKLEIDIRTPHLIAAGKNITNARIVTKTVEDYIVADIRADIVNDKTDINSISIHNLLKNNTINTKIAVENEGDKKTKGEFNINTHFTKNKKEPLQIDFDILPSELLLNKATWLLEESKIRLAENSITVDNFFMHTIDNQQELRVDGEYSPTNTDCTLNAELKKIDLAYVFETLAIDALKFAGQATGKLVVSSIEGKPYANTNLEVADFGFNYSPLGTLTLYSELDDKTNFVSLNGTLLSEENKETYIKGTIDPINEKISIYFDADSLSIGFLSLYTKSIFDHISGRGSGQVHLSGDFSDVTVEGKVYVHKANIGISFLNTEYTFSDSIYLKKDLIYFNDMALVDKYKNVSLASGKVSHNYFSDFLYHIDIAANQFLVYNATEKENPVFYGNVFASGNGSIGGDEREVNIDISMRTDKNTKVQMNFMEAVVNEYKFVTYVNNTSPELEDEPNALKYLSPIKANSSMAINMNFYIDATPDAVVEIVMDPIVGDVISATGNGTLQFEWNTKDAPRIFGTYNINRGNYNFTFQRLMERMFSIEDGSSIQFKGDPFEAMLNVEALYKITANLNDLDRELVESTGQTSIPVNCILNLTGPLRQPKVGLDIAFPRTDAEVERQLKSLMDTEDMINRQVTYLLILSKFYTPSYATTEYRTSDFAAVASATLSNQLSKIVSQIDKRWQVGTNIRTSDAEFTSTEVELILSSQLLDNRLLINGNFGYRDDPSKEVNNAFIGDIDIEFLLNNSGSWRIKAYNHYNEKYYYNQSATQTQGIGIMYKRNFDHIKELYFWQRPKKKEDETKIPTTSENEDDEFSSFVKIKK